ncbi:MAG: Gmad2 immunoglobulin-like domain-containing protein [Dehalococcoidia bacterium]
MKIIVGVMKHGLRRWWFLAAVVAALWVGSGSASPVGQPAPQVATVALPPPGGVVSLYAGWNNVALTFPDGTPMVAVVAAVSPPQALAIVWRYDAPAQQWHGFDPEAPPAVNTLTSVDFLDAVFVRVPPNVCGPNPDPADPSRVQVDNPAAGAAVASPVPVSGMAAVFEAVVSIRLVDKDGAILVDTFTMTQGPEFFIPSPYATDVAFSVSVPTPACLWVFEASAATGEPTNVVQVPLLLLP